MRGLFRGDTLILDGLTFVVLGLGAAAGRMAAAVNAVTITGGVMLCLSGLAVVAGEIYRLRGTDCERRVMNSWWFSLTLLAFLAVYNLL